MDLQLVFVWAGIASIILIPLAASVVCWLHPVEGSMGRRFFAGAHGALILSALAVAQLISPITARETALHLPLLACLAGVVVAALISNIVGLIAHRRSVAAIVLIVLAAPIELYLSALAAVTIAHIQFRLM